MLLLPGELQFGAPVPGSKVVVVVVVVVVGVPAGTPWQLTELPVVAVKGRLSLLGTWDTDRLTLVRFSELVE